LAEHPHPAGEELTWVQKPLEPFIIYHNGPGQAYLSRSTTDDLDAYEGDGDWYKIGSLGAKNDSWWLTRDQTGMNFTIPETTPPGKYLLRVEHLYVRPRFNTTQFYIACAQIDVRGRRDEADQWRVPNLEYTVRFPGAYDLDDEGEARLALPQLQQINRERGTEIHSNLVQEYWLRITSMTGPRLVS
jgi:hypothetical protein